MGVNKITFKTSNYLWLKERADNMSSQSLRNKSQCFFLFLFPITRACHSICSKTIHQCKQGGKYQRLRKDHLSQAQCEGQIKHSNTRGVVKKGRERIVVCLSQNYWMWQYCLCDDYGRFIFSSSVKCKYNQINTTVQYAYTVLMWNT